MAQDKEVLSEFDKLSPAQEAIALKIHTEALSAGIDPELALATAWQENRFRPQGKSSAGALGPMQVMPSTAKLYGVKLKDLTNPDVNIKLGVQILKENLDRYEGNKELALIAYNAGPTVADRYMEKSDPKVLPKETQNYLKGISQYHDVTAPSSADRTITSEGGAEDDIGPNPFEEYAKEMESDIGPSPFPDLSGGAGFKFEDAPPMGNASHINPVLYGLTAGPAAFGAQYMMNRGVPREERYPSPPTAEDVERRFKPQLSSLEDELKSLNVQEKRASMPQPESGAAMPGDKWSTKTVGAQGPGGETTTEAARNYRIQQRLQVAPDVENPLYRPNRAGVILPIGLAQEQQQAEAAQMEAERARMQQQRERLEAEQRRIQEERRQAINQAMKKQSILNQIGMNTRQYMTTSPALTGLSQATAGYFADEARQRWDKGDMLGSAISGVKALGAGIGGLPIPPRYGPLLRVKGYGQLGLGAGLVADELRTRLGFNPEYKDYKPKP